MLPFHLIFQAVDDSGHVPIELLFFRTTIRSSSPGVTSQDRLSYATVTNNLNISGALRNKCLFLVVKKKSFLILVKEWQGDFIQGGKW